MALNRDIQEILRSVEQLNSTVERTQQLFDRVNPPSGADEVKEFADAFADLESEVQSIVNSSRRAQDPLERFAEVGPALREAAQNSELFAGAFRELTREIRESNNQTRTLRNAFAAGLGGQGSFLVQINEGVESLIRELRGVTQVAEATGQDISRALINSISRRVIGRAGGTLVRGLNALGRRGAQALFAPFTVLGRGVLQGINEVFIGFFEQIGRSAVEGLGRQLTSVIQNSIGDFNEYGAAIASVNTILADYEVQQVRLNEVISESIRLSANQFSDVEVAEAFYSALSSGAEDLAEAQQLVNSALALSVAGGGSESSIGASLEDTQALVAGIINSFRSAADDIRLGFEDANRVASILFKTTELGQITLAGLASQFGEITSIAAAAGIELEDLAASVATVTQAGVNTNIAVTGIQNIIQRVLDPTQEALELANQLGLALGPQLLDSAQGGGLTVLAERLSVLQEQGRLTTGTISSLFGIEAGRSLFPLINQVERQANNLQELREAGSGGAVSEAAITQLRSTAATFTGVANAFDSLVTSIGSIPTNFLQPILAVFQELFNDIRESFQENLQGISAVAFAAGDLIAGTFENILGGVGDVGTQITRQVSNLAGIDFDQVVAFQQRNNEANDAVTAIQEGRDPGGIFSGQSIDEISQVLQTQNRDAEEAFRQEIAAGISGLVAEVGTRIEGIIDSIRGIGEFLFDVGRAVIEGVVQIVTLLGRGVNAIISRIGNEGERDAARFVEAAAANPENLNLDVAQVVAEAVRGASDNDRLNRFGDQFDQILTNQTRISEAQAATLAEALIGTGAISREDASREEVETFLQQLVDIEGGLRGAFLGLRRTNDTQFALANDAIDSAQALGQTVEETANSLGALRDVNIEAVGAAFNQIASIDVGDNVEELTNPFAALANEVEGEARDNFLAIFDGVEGAIDSDELNLIFENLRTAIEPFAGTSFSLTQALNLLDERLADVSDSLTQAQERIRTDLGFEGISDEVSRSLQSQGPVIASFLGNSFRENAPVALEQLRLQIIDSLATRAGEVGSAANEAIREELADVSFADIVADNDILLQIPDSTLNDVVRNIFAGIEATFENLTSAAAEYNGVLESQISATQEFVNAVSEAGQGILDTQQTGADLILGAAISQLDTDPNNIIDRSIANADTGQIRELVNTINNQFATVGEQVAARQELQELGVGGGENLQQLIDVIEADNERQLGTLQTLNTEIINSRSVAQEQNAIALAGANETVATLQSEISSVRQILESGNQLDITQTQQRQAQLDALQTEFETASRLQRDLAQNQEAGGLDPRALISSLESQAGFLRQQQQLLRNLGRGDEAQAFDAQLSEIGEQLIRLAPEAAQRDIQAATDTLNIANEQLSAQQNILSLLEGVFPDVAAALDNLVANNRNATLERFDENNPLGDLDIEEIPAAINSELQERFQALEVIAQNTDGLISVTQAVADGQLTESELAQLAGLSEAREDLGGASAAQLAGIAQSDLTELFSAITGNLTEGNTDFVQTLLNELLGNTTLPEVIQEQPVVPQIDVDASPIADAFVASIEQATFSAGQEIQLEPGDIVQPIQISPEQLGFENVNRRQFGLANAPIVTEGLDAERLAAINAQIEVNRAQLAAVERQTAAIENIPAVQEGNATFNVDRIPDVGTPVDFTRQLDAPVNSLISSFQAIDDELGAFETSLFGFGDRIDRVGQRISENEFDLQLGGGPAGVDEQLINSVLNLGPAGFNFDQIFDSNLIAPQDIEPLIAGIVDNALGQSNDQVAASLTSAINDTFGNLEGIVDTGSEIAGINSIISNLGDSIDSLGADLDLGTDGGQNELLRRAQELASLIDNVAVVLAQSQGEGAQGLGEPLNELQVLLGRLSTELPDDIQTAISDATITPEDTGTAQGVAEALSSALGATLGANAGQAAAEVEQTPLQAAEDSLTSFSSTSATVLQAFATQAQNDLSDLSAAGRESFEETSVNLEAVLDNIEILAQNLNNQGQRNLDATNQPQQGEIDSRRNVERPQEFTALTSEFQRLNDILTSSNVGTTGGVTIDNIAVNVEVTSASNETVAEDIGVEVQRGLESVLTNVLERI